MDTSSRQRSVGEKRGGGSRRRRFRSLELKRQIVEETLGDDTSVAVVARRHGVNANQVFSWRRQYHRGELTGRAEETSDPMLLPVQIHHSAAEAQPESPGTGEVAVVEECLEIEFSGGRHLRVWGRTDLDVLRTVLRELLQS